MSRLIAFLVGLTLLIGSSAALAQPAPAGRSFYDKRPTIYTFDQDEVIVTDILGPEEGWVEIVKGTRFPTLIQIRHDYRDEVVKDAEDI